MIDHRDKKLDSLIGKKVTVTLFNGYQTTGALSYEERYGAPNYRKPGYYYVNHAGFRKSHVKSIKEEAGK